MHLKLPICFKLFMNVSLISSLGFYMYEAITAMVDKTKIVQEIRHQAKCNGLYQHIL